MFARLPLYLRLVRMDKPIGSLLLLWPTLNALWIASDGHPSLSLLVIFVFVRVAYIPAALLIGVWGLIQFLNLGAIAQQPTGAGVAYAAHVGGFIFGTVVARLFGRTGNDPKLEWAR